MAVPSNYRWIAVGSMTIRSRANAADNAPVFDLNDVYNALRSRATAGEGYRYYQNNDRAMWCTLLRETVDYYEMVIETGDKNVSGLAFFHFENQSSRDVEKDDEEGGHYTSHVIIKRQPDMHGRHLILIERLPGVYLGSVKAHLTWVCNNEQFEKVAEGVDGEDRTYRAIVEIDGYRSRTIGQALRAGTLQDLEFISVEQNFNDGLDENAVVREIVREAKWQVGRRVTDEEAATVFERAKTYLTELVEGGTPSKLFVRIKTNSGQIKRTEVDDGGDEVLEQAFVQNEFVSNFDQPLPPKYEDFHEEIIGKIRVIGAEIDD